MGAMSPRRTAPHQMLTPWARRTSPTTVAFSATNTPLLSTSFMGFLVRLWIVDCGLWISAIGLVVLGAGAFAEDAEEPVLLAFEHIHDARDPVGAPPRRVLAGPLLADRLGVGSGAGL